MEKSFKECVEMINNNKTLVKKLIEIQEILEKVKNHSCRGEVTIYETNTNLSLNTDRVPLIQVHYEFFNISINEKLTILTRHLSDGNIGTLDYTHIDTSKIVSYEIDNTSIILHGELSENVKFQVLVVLNENI